MKIVRDVILKDKNKTPIIIIGISVLMLILSLCNVSINFADEVTLSVQFGGLWSAALSILPLTWGMSTALLIKTKKVFFAKLPSYIICAMIAIVLILYYIASSNGDVVINLLIFALAILLIYPFVIATLTLEGRLYNKVFATAFSAILLVICIIAAVAVSFAIKSFMFSALIPVLVYTELVLIVHCFDLKKPKKKTEEYKPVYK